MGMFTSRRYLRFLGIATLFLFIYWLRQPADTNVAPFSKPTRKLSFVKSSFDWSKLTPFNPPPSIIPLPTGKRHTLPRIQHKFSSQARADIAKQEKRRQAVKAAFRKCWANYRQYAWMKDELEPMTGGHKTTFGGFAATLVDSLDTLWIMDLKDEFDEAASAAAALDWGNTTVSSVNMFETTIRHLGGLLSAYDLSGDENILNKAIELGNMLYMGFDTPNRMPGFWLDFDKAKTGNLVADDHIASASPGSLSLEFTRLAQLTGDSKYYDAIARITANLERTQFSTQLPGMWPTFFDARDLAFDQDNSFTLGALADSLYEYLPKMHALLGGLEPAYKKMFKSATKPISEYLLFRPMLPDQADILFTGTATTFNDDIELDPEGQHLGCFVGGMFALAGRLFEKQQWVDTGAKVTRGCIYAYNAFPSGIMPEVFNMIACQSLDGCDWDEKLWNETRINEHIPRGFTTVRAPYYILRPEAIESVFILYRITGLKEFQEAAWQMFESIQRATDARFGNAGIEDVTVPNPIQRDSMESFWLAETLKYFYLIFSPPDLISLDEYVFNTEAHPFRLPR